MTRVMVDTNVFVSYLLRPGSNNAPNQVVNAAFARRFEMILSETTLAELARSVRDKPWLAAHIETGNMDAFTTELNQIAVIVPELAESLPSVTRDPKDDYLIAHAVLENIDYLVTGDKDLLVLKQIDTTRIVSPAEFVAILETETGD